MVRNFKNDPAVFVKCICVYICVSLLHLFSVGAQLQSGSLYLRAVYHYHVIIIYKQRMFFGTIKSVFFSSLRFLLYIFLSYFPISRSYFILSFFSLFKKTTYIYVCIYVYIHIYLSRVRLLLLYPFLSIEPYHSLINSRMPSSAAALRLLKKRFSFYQLAAVSMLVAHGPLYMYVLHVYSLIYRSLVYACVSVTCFVSHINYIYPFFFFNNIYHIVYIFIFVFIFYLIYYVPVIIIVIVNTNI